MRNAILAMAMLRLAAGAATAEPIRFGYATTGGGSYEESYPSGRGDGETAYVYLGLNSFPERTFDSPGDEHYRDRSGDTIRTGARFSVFSRRDWRGGASLSFRDELSPPALPVTLTIRDFASGETADIPLSYRLYYSDSIGEHLFLNARDSELVGRVALGASVYEFRKDWEDENGMFVSVSPAGTVAATPEPATLLLAGLGLAGVAVRRMRRR